MSTAKNKKENISPTGKKGTPNALDVHVGNRLRTLRKIMGLSQEKLADAVDLTFQQVQKYERGANRISASRLYSFAEVLDVPITYFFQDYGKEIQSFDPVGGFSDNEQEPIETPVDLLYKRESLDIIRSYHAIPDATIRKHFRNLIHFTAKRLNPDHPYIQGVLPPEDSDTESDQDTFSY